jgi:hypothetical protein
MTSFTFSLEQLLAAPPEVRRWAEQEIGAALTRLAGRAAPPRGMILPYHAAGEFPLRHAAMQQPLLPGIATAVPPFTAARDAEAGHPAAGSATPAQPAETGSQGAGSHDVGGQQAGGQQAPAIAACSADEAVRLFGLLEDDLPTAQVFFEFGRENATAVPEQRLCAYTIGDIMRHARLTDGRQLLTCLKRINTAFQQLRGAGDLSLFGIDGNGYLYLHETTHQSIHRLWADLLALEAEKHPHPIELGQA